MRQGRHLQIAVGGERFAADAGRVAAVADVVSVTPFPLPAAAPSPVAHGALRVEGLGRFADAPLLQLAPPGAAAAGGRLLVYGGSLGLVGVRVDRVERLSEEGAATDLPPFGAAVPAGGDAPAPAPHRPPDAPPAGTFSLLLAASDGATVGVPAADVRRVAAVERAYDRPGGGTLVAVVDGRLREARSLAQRLGRPERCEPWAVVPAAEDAPVLLVERAVALCTVDPATLCRTAAADGTARVWWTDPAGTLVEILADVGAAALPAASAPVPPAPAQPALRLIGGRHRLLAPLATVRAILRPDDLPPWAAPRSSVPVLDLARLLDGVAAGPRRRAVLLEAAGRPLLVLADDAAVVAVAPDAPHPIPQPPAEVAALFDAVVLDPACGQWQFRLRGDVAFAGLPYALRRRVARSLAGWSSREAVAGAMAGAAEPSPAAAAVATRIPEPA
ncbi:hypothetical protein [Azospirillum sp. ST 5-10]|uniref:hypothetical protein n=1 Tax=unclassified Azospirillum TaxID=2630922 RepID=UPI003F4A2996